MTANTQEPYEWSASSYAQTEQKSCQGRMTTLSGQATWSTSRLEPEDGLAERPTNSGTHGHQEVLVTQQPLVYRRNIWFDNPMWSRPLTPSASYWAFPHSHIHQPATGVLNIEDVLQLQGSRLGRLSRKSGHLTPRNTTSATNHNSTTIPRGGWRPYGSNPRHNLNQSPRKQAMPFLQEMVEQQPQLAENCDEEAKSARLQVQGLARSHIAHRAMQGQEYVWRGHWYALHRDECESAQNAKQGSSASGKTLNT